MAKIFENEKYEIKIRDELYENCEKNIEILTKYSENIFSKFLLGD